MHATHSLAEDVALALRAADAAAEVALRYFGRDHVVSYKTADQPVTEADREADRVLHEVLLAERPGYGWLSEETADSPARLDRERVWIVDPIDGTRSFIAGRPEYAISIGLAVAGAAVLGVVLNPSTRERYHAVRGGGAYRGERRLRVRADTRPPGARTLVVSRSDARRAWLEPLRAAWEVGSLGSTAYKMVRVADGGFHGYVSRGQKAEWDVCGAALILEEAGGRATDVFGGALRFNQPVPNLRGMVAATPSAHAELLQFVAAAPAGTDVAQGDP